MSAELRTLYQPLSFSRTWNCTDVVVSCSVPNDTAYLGLRATAPRGSSCCGGGLLDDTRPRHFSFDNTGVNALPTGGRANMKQFSWYLALYLILSDRTIELEA